MTEFMVMGWIDGKWTGVGSHEFRTPPRKGDIIGWDDENGVGQAYEVVAVMHPLEPATTSGDLLVRHISTDLEFRQKIQETYAPHAT